MYVPRECKKCGYQWPGRGEKKPKTCPKCKSLTWDTLAQKGTQRITCPHCAEGIRLDWQREWRCWKTTKTD